MAYRKQRRVVGDTVITESKQNTPWKGNCLYLISWKFRFAFSVQQFFTDQNTNTVNQSEIRFQIFSNATGYGKQHHVIGDTVPGPETGFSLCKLLKSCVGYMFSTLFTFLTSPLLLVSRPPPSVKNELVTKTDQFCTAHRQVHNCAGKGDRVCDC